MIKDPAEVRDIPAQLAAREPLGVDDLDLEQIEGSLDANPKWETLLRYLAIEYFKRGYFKRAHFAYGTLAQCEPPSDNDLVGYARCQILLGERTPAVETLLQIIEITEDFSDNHKWAREKIKVLVATAAPLPPDEAAAGPAGSETAGPLATSAPQQEAGSTSPSLEGSMAADEGAAPVGPLAADDPKTARVISTLEQLGVVTSHDAPNSEQIDSARQKLAENPNDPAILDWYAFLLYSAGKISECITVYEQLLAIGNPAPSALYYLGNAYLKLSRLDKAVQCWERLKTVEPESPLVKKVGRTLERLSQLRSKARNRSTTPDAAYSTTADSGSSSPASAAGTSPAEPGRTTPTTSSTAMPAASSSPAPTESGLDEIEAVVLQNPYKAEVLDWAAFAHFTAGNLARALAYYQHSLLIEDDNPDAYFYVGAIYCRLGKFPQAVQSWQQLLSGYPDHPLAQKARPKYELLAKA